MRRDQGTMIRPTAQPRVRQTCEMVSRADHAKLALRIVEGIAKGNSDADALIIESFDDPMTAAVAYAYLAGFMLEALAAEDPKRSIEGAASRIQRLLDQRQ